jgi:mono/diheme cytochrome c family protein
MTAARGSLGAYAVLLLVVCLLASMAAAVSLDAQQNGEAAALKNPTPATPDSIASGQQLYSRFCRACHGSTGNGGLGPSLIDETWNHGSSDGEIYWVIRNGAGDRMEAWDDRLSEADTWNVVNYIRSLAAPK